MANTTKKNSNDKKDRFTGTTPRAISIWPHLFTPQTKFKPEGTYDCKIRLKEGDCDGLIAEIDNVISQARVMAEETCRTPRDKAKLKAAQEPYEDEMDNEGNLTGYVLFRFKKQASGTTKDGEKWTAKLPVFDSKGAPITKDIGARSGTEVKVAYELRPFYVPSFGYGCSCRLNAVQILSLVTSNQDSSSFGFGAEDDGFDMADEDASSVFGESVRDSDSDIDTTGEGDF
jgi:hypothetical protein